MNQSILRDTFRELIGSLNLPNPATVLDLPSGLGSMVKVFRECFRDLKAEFTCVDLDSAALEVAKTELAGEIINYVPGDVQNLRLLDSSFDLVMFANAIHNIPDKLKSLEEAFRVTKPGGFLYGITTFTKESMPEETFQFYQKATALGVRKLRELGVAREHGQERIEFLSIDAYNKLLEQTGWCGVVMKTLWRDVYLDVWQAIAKDRDYSSGVLRGYPAEQAARALPEATKEALKLTGFTDSSGEKYIPRLWMYFRSQKPVAI
ncbi:MAG: SAM-dependent methyltransferase [Dehalococcoidia bacterium]|nr:SAM-dependent methyltransferase [Dehalococcoidia bacterium]